jgi:predicted lipoprotein with Yx(FWY)xxD motif
MARDPAERERGGGSRAVRSSAARWLTRRRVIPGLIVVAVAGAIAALVALSLSGSSAGGGASGPSLSVGDSSLGKILLDQRGLVLYMYGHDGRNSSNCTGVCERVWPPATVSGKPTLGPGVSPARVRRIKRSDQSMQLVYNGHPLYTFSEDTRRGQMGGEGFLGVWFVVSPTGKPVKKPGSTSAPAGY